MDAAEDDPPEALGQASAVVEDTTVNALGVPKDSSLKLGQAKPEAEKIAQEMVDALEDVEGVLYSGDISVVDRDGAEWQPEGKVRMELQVPDFRLAEHQKLYVVHVSDDGHANYIDATLTDKGTIVFDTDGFSAYKVIYTRASTTTSTTHWNDTSRRLSTLMEAFYTSIDITKVDPSSVKISHPEIVSLTLDSIDINDVTYRDWILRARMKNFSETVKLTFKVTGDTTTYTINITSTSSVIPAYAYLSSNTTLETSSDTLVEDDHNGTMTWYLNSSGAAKNAAGVSGDADGYSASKYLLIDGPGFMNITLQNRSYDATTKTSTNKDLVLNLYQIRVLNGATLHFRLGGNFQGDETITIKGLGDRPMFYVDNGTLMIRVNDTTYLPESLKNSNVFNS